ncbi:GatB/YqeY domain-containing protein [Aspergillus heteromorphus CBS 117.55]|uniref:Altered inheritance of mitochondria protein 41 n=1 Tax=Aspergillus heteromorphus CBS 117.55 TaxID=1448321 RepID=A0A317WZK6_9EURO|nr:GatB/YqeY domain-containing protein [Aspergillus heteromorphus CBS 117.55]PWY90697.1 GatB/YqeY domain-containing protein [Aspergillus heteromorphus CBS 117.55]
MLQSMRLTPRLGLGLAVRQVRWNSTGPVLPPLMATLRTDLKTAMRAKDKPRLNVLRALISETNNAAKTNSPIETDLQLLGLIKKRIALSQDAIKEFEAENRPDLTEGEQQHVTVLEEYGAQVQTMSLDDIKTIVSEEIAKVKESGEKPQMGSLLKSLFSSGGALDGKPAERAEVARIVKEAVASA